MRGPGCIQAGTWMERRAAGLSAPDRLRLEEHLGGCIDCGREATLLEALSGLVANQPETLDLAARKRAIDGALRQAPAHESAPRALRSPLVLAAALAALAMLAVVSWQAGGRAPFAGRTTADATPGDAMAAEHAQGERPRASDSAAAAAPRPVPVGRIASGAVVHKGEPLTTGASIPANELLTSEGGAELALGRARVELRPGSALRWSPESETLSLERGSVLCEVVARDGTHFRVRTEHMTAVVLGTRFEVTPTGVLVHEGRVQVLSPDGTVLADGLGPNGHFEVRSPAEAEARAAADDSHASPAKARALLAGARAHLGRGATDQARSAISRALSMSPGRALRAEALSLRAEAYLVEGKRGAAVKAYLEVATRFAPLPAGESALFAAARLEATAGSARARGLLDRYLKRYPRGRFVREVRSRQRALSDTPTP